MAPHGVGMLNSTGCIGRKSRRVRPVGQVGGLSAMSKLRIEEKDGAITFEVRVAPRASRNRVIGVFDGMLKVVLTAAPVEGAANEALKKLIAKELRVSKTDVEIVRGERARTKLLRIHGVKSGQISFDDASSR